MIVTKTTCALTRENLLPEEIRYAYKLPCLKLTPASSETVYGFSKEEVYQMSAIVPGGIHLYGFKKRAGFKIQNIYKAPCFVRPDDQAYKGSSEIFTQLLYSMLKRDLIGIVKTALRKNEQTRFSALVPQEEEVDNKGRIIHPVGFFLFPLPFKNDLRYTWRKELPEAEAVQLKNEEEEMGKKVDMTNMVLGRKLHVNSEGNCRGRKSPLSPQRFRGSGLCQVLRRAGVARGNCLFGYE